MRVIPKTAFNKIMFFQTHIQRWADRATQLGLSGDEIADLQAKFDAADSAFKAQQAAQRTARGATADFHEASNALAQAGAAAILKIRGTAGSTGDPGIYNLAAIDAPKKSIPYRRTGQAR